MFGMYIYIVWNEGTGTAAFLCSGSFFQPSTLVGDFFLYTPLRQPFPKSLHVTAAAAAAQRAINITINTPFGRFACSGLEEFLRDVV